MLNLLLIPSICVSILGFALLLVVFLLNSDKVSEDTKDEICEELGISRRFRISMELQEDDVVNTLMMLCFPYINVFVFLTLIFMWYCRRK